MSWEISLPDSHVEGSFRGGDIFDTKQEALEYVQRAWGADSEGRIFIVNDLGCPYCGGHADECDLEAGTACDEAQAGGFDDD